MSAQENIRCLVIDHQDEQVDFVLSVRCFAIFNSKGSLYCFFEEYSMCDLNTNKRRSNVGEIPAALTLYYPFTRQIICNNISECLVFRKILKHLNEVI